MNEDFCVREFVIPNWSDDAPMSNLIASRISSQDEGDLCLGVFSSLYPISEFEDKFFFTGKHDVNIEDLYRMHSFVVG